MIDLICIVSRLTAQNELLERFIRNSIGLETTSCRSADDISVTCRLSKNALVLFDFNCIEPADLDNFPTCLMDSTDSRKNRLQVAVFNAAPDFDQQEQLVIKGVQGILYENDPLSVLEKGISLMAKGELWVSRKQLENCLKCTIHAREIDPELEVVLSNREKQVLARLATGASNDEIADDMCISTYTVKAHNYRIYKKIGVNNRMQATLWALHSQNLLETLPTPSKSDKSKNF